MKRPLVYALIAVFALSPPLYAQEAIEIEIDSAPVEIEIPEPAVPAEPEEPEIQTVQTEPEEPEKETGKGKKYGLAIGIGALVAGAIAALAGGGGGSTSSHSP